MKRITIVIFVGFLSSLIFSNSLFSQISNYKPFPLLQASWIVTETGPFITGQQTNSWSQYEANGDTIIGSYTYKKVYGAYATNVPIFGPKSFSFGYRNDIPNKKVHILTKINGQYKDTLWYDFNLTIGDTLKETYSSGNFYSPLPHNPMYYDRRIVKSIDSVLICNEYYKRFNFNCGAGGFQNLGLVEGFGFEDNFKQIGSVECPFEPMYLYDTKFSCSLSINEMETSKKQLKVLPNPVLNNLQINLPEQNFVFPYQYSIIDCLGKTIIKGTSTDNKSIDVSKIKNGLYFLMVEDNQKNLFQSKFLKQ